MALNVEQCLLGLPGAIYSMKSPVAVSCVILRKNYLGHLNGFSPNLATKSNLIRTAV